jgi:hypothetical protein
VPKLTNTKGTKYIIIPQAKKLKKKKKNINCFLE